MITANVSGQMDLVTGQITQTITFQGFELALGMILGAIAAVVIWSVFKPTGK